MLELVRFCTHYGMHFLVPGIIAYVFFRNDWKKVWLILIATMVIDIDHLLATPIFEENRCSINFHPLHTYYAGFFYLLLLFHPKTRVIGIGLLFHLVTDFTDCFWIS